MPRPYALQQQRKVFFYAAVEDYQHNGGQYEGYAHGLAESERLAEHERTDAHCRHRLKRAEY